MRIAERWSMRHKTRRRNSWRLVEAEGAPRAAVRSANGHGNQDNTVHSSSFPTQPSTTTRPLPSRPAQPARMKRPLEVIDSNQDPLKSKRARITVEIVAARSRPSALSSPSSKHSIARLPPSRPQPMLQQTTLHNHWRRIVPQSTVAPPPPPTPPAHEAPKSPPIPIPRPPLPSRPLNHRTPITTTTTSTPIVAPTHESRQLLQQRPLPTSTNHPPEPTSNTSTTASNAPPAATKPQKKVVDGIKHELDRLQPSAADTSATAPTGRKLRSQEATRFKSELSAYFPEYDEVIGNDPKEQHLLNADTPIVIVDSRLSTARDTSSRHNGHVLLAADHPIRSFSDSLFTDLAEASRVDFGLIDHKKHDDGWSDPLADSFYSPSHRKAARLEKSIRNTERSRAQHEKDQIVRILGDLQGHDWLRTMGVNGVTETRKKSFEPAREHFIRGCQAILGKFRHWSQEEKRRKLEKERALAEEEEDEDDEEETLNDDSDVSEVSHDDNVQGSGDDDVGRPRFKRAAAPRTRALRNVEMSEEHDEDEDNDEESDGDPPDSSDVDASIARQLRDEAALAREKYQKSHPTKRPRSDSFAQSSEQDSPSRRRDFTSFFHKRHQRDAALNRSRRRGRIAVAWGHDVPEFDVYDFDLPDELRDPETMKTRERQKRRARREAKH
ncbi:something about silencing, SAS, complex subunit 4-domain-containing protein [Microdochium trichocladiopsis]|uniref:Something about silencing, SAS, complex subunit 4-domain-containing protein n=1 Tax=Microdochium trichocladiopsis TaxID=1682393 RepID=A0A9P9BNJ4_9PEZI|nr:something about silencing, SAS, complex subunit 4-domain-containing protein [Microdochium trichocladiopsis]KAH7027474.1 something about silencing, SAS, complex subunit 4-domain-containing protein [Microdochium trichocladiopsis]